MLRFRMDSTKLDCEKAVGDVIIRAMLPAADLSTVIG